MALNFYGHPRLTNDFDIVIAVSDRDHDRLLKLFEGDFYITEPAVRQALGQRTMFNIIDFETVFKVDLIIKKPLPYADLQFERAIRKEFEGISVNVISPEDLILSKLDWSRDSDSEMQKRDVRSLLSVLSKDLDFAYLESWAERLGLLERLKALYASA